MTASVAFRWSVSPVGFAPTGSAALFTAHGRNDDGFVLAPCRNVSRRRVPGPKHGLTCVYPASLIDRFTLGSGDSRRRAQQPARQCCLVHPVWRTLSASTCLRRLRDLQARGIVSDVPRPKASSKERGFSTWPCAWARRGRALDGLPRLTMA